MDTIRVGIIGAGFIGRIHAEFFSQVSGVEVVGITDVKTALAESAAQMFGISAVFPDASALISDPNIDAVVIGVPNRFHKPLALEAIAAGKAVLLEKPMALSGAEAAAIRDAAEKAGATLMIAHHARWEPLAQRAKALVEAGELGHVYYARATTMRRKAIPGWGSWFTRKAESGGGPLIDIGVHALDLALWLMGNPDPVSVFGTTFAMFGPKTKGIGTWGTPEWDGVFDVEDLATAQIKLAGGAALNLDVSWAVNTDSDDGQQIHLAGTDGGISLYGNRMVLTGQKFDQSFNVVVDAPEQATHPRLLLAQHFVACVREKRTPISDARSGWVNSTVLDAIYESARTGDVVKLSLT